MSRENVEVVQRIFRVWAEGVEHGDRGALTAPFDEGLLTPDSTFTPLPEVPGGGGNTYVGARGLREFVRAWTESWVDWRVTLEEVIDAGEDHVVGVIHQSATGKGSGAPVSFRFAMVFTFKDGRVIDRRDYRDRAEALEVAESLRET
jgi:ketosteroid isomerase-like protein